jgi:hypothetical protein
MITIVADMMMIALVTGDSGVVNGRDNNSISQQSNSKEVLPAIRIPAR